jgi:hypothetical protein
LIIITLPPYSSIKLAAATLTIVVPDKAAEKPSYFLARLMFERQNLVDRQNLGA